MEMQQDSGDLDLQAAACCR